jgi:hypothetical protein
MGRSGLDLWAHEVYTESRDDHEDDPPFSRFHSPRLDRCRSIPDGRSMSDGLCTIYSRGLRHAVLQIDSDAEMSARADSDAARYDRRFAYLVFHAAPGVFYSCGGTDLKAGPSRVRISTLHRCLPFSRRRPDLRRTRTPCRLHPAVRVNP